MAAGWYQAGLNAVTASGRLKYACDPALADRQAFLCHLLRSFRWLEVWSKWERLMALERPTARSLPEQRIGWLAHLSCASSAVPWRAVSTP